MAEAPQVQRTSFENRKCDLIKRTGIELLVEMVSISMLTFSKGAVDLVQPAYSELILHIRRVNTEQDFLKSHVQRLSTQYKQAMVQRTPVCVIHDQQGTQRS